MRLDPDKSKRLEALADKLLDVYLLEADPDQWETQESAAERAEKMRQQGSSSKEVAQVLFGWKGERYWEKKNANQTMALLLGINRFIDQRADLPESGEEDDDEAKAAAREVARLEAQAKKRLARTRPMLVVSNK